MSGPQYDGASPNEDGHDLTGLSFYSARDHELLERLASEACWSERHEALLLELWAQGFQATEDLSAFLLRKNVLHPRALDLLDRPGFADTESIFRHDGLARLEAMLDRLESQPLGATLDGSVLDDLDTPREPWASVQDTTLNLLAGGETAEMPSGQDWGFAWEAGHVLANWELVRLLYTSGQAMVFRAVHTESGQRALLKAQPILASQHEAEVLGRFDHPNIPRLLDEGSVGPTTFLVLEHIEGPSLADLLAEGHLPCVRTIVDWGLQLAHALGAMAREGFVHCNLSPEHVFIASDQTLRLLEFSQTVQLPQLPSGQFAPRTVPGLVGSPAYLSPEQAEEGQVDARSDQYSLGVILYQLLTGRQPFAAQTWSEVLLETRTTRPEPPMRLNPTISARVSRAVLTMLSRSPDDRFQSFDEIIGILSTSLATT